MGLVLMIAGVVVLVRGLKLKEDENTIGSLKYRQLLIGGASIFFGLIIFFR